MEIFVTYLIRLIQNQIFRFLSPWSMYMWLLALFKIPKSCSLGRCSPNSSPVWTIRSKMTSVKQLVLNISLKWGTEGEYPCNDPIFYFGDNWENTKISSECKRKVFFHWQIYKKDPIRQSTVPLLWLWSGKPLLSLISFSFCSVSKPQVFHFLQLLAW